MLGNQWSVKNFGVSGATLLEKGSACQADCSARPSPNRILKECRNLNGCTFYTDSSETGDDEGLKAANACDLYTVGSWAKFDTINEIKCPLGPLRKSMFTTEQLTYGFESCENVKITKYPIFINGKTVFMSIISCIN